MEIMEMKRESENYIKDGKKIYRARIITVEEFDEYQKLHEKNKDDILWSYKYLAKYFIYRYVKILFWNIKVYDFKYNRGTKPQQLELGRAIEKLVMNFLGKEQERGGAITE